MGITNLFVTTASLRISERQRLRHSGGWETLGITVLMLAAASIPLTVAYDTLADHHALKTEWAIDGPACEAPAEPIRFHRAPRVFTYRGIDFKRYYGNVNGIVAPEGNILSNAGHTVCQFSSPGAVSVTTGGRTVTYEPGFGYPATVSIRNGEASCVVGGWFR